MFSTILEVNLKLEHKKTKNLKNDEILLFFCEKKKWEKSEKITFFFGEKKLKK